MMKRLIGMALTMFVGLMLVGTLGASAAPNHGNMKAVVVKQQLMATGGVKVTLSVISPSWRDGQATIKPMKYGWDYTTDGIIESAMSVNPTVSYVYGVTATNKITATVTAIGGSAISGERASVTFSLLGMLGSPNQVGMQAVVVKQQLMATGGVKVTLSVISPSWRDGQATIKPIKYGWDYTTDGIIESAMSVNPTVSYVYAPTATNKITATVTAIGGSAISGERASVTFYLLGS